MTPTTKHLRSVTIDELDHLQVDANDELYWKGTKLTDIRTFAEVIAISAGIGALTSIGLLVLEIGRSAGWWGG